MGLFSPFCGYTCTHFFPLGAGVFAPLVFSQFFYFVSCSLACILFWLMLLWHGIFYFAHTLFGTLFLQRENHNLSRVILFKFEFQSCEHETSLNIVSKFEQESTQV